MAENVVLSVQLQGAEAAIAQLTQLDTVLKSIKANRSIKINVSGTSLTKAATDAKNLGDNLDDVQKKAKEIGTTGSKHIDRVGESLKGGSKNAESFRKGLGNVLTTMLKFRAASMAINFAINAFTSAFKEMKNVDTELVNIRKVTGYTNEEIAKLTKTAYSLATNYGRTASEVLQASTVFARAGYTDQIEQLSELSLLLQNVGDLEAEDASKFIIATDKAYKLGGSYEKLMAIIDGLDNITNKNATDMQKMTEGMTVAGSVFAESGESVEVFAALLGTATSATQRSGSEVGRALRTILMNIRQIRGETEDGELIDGESWATAAKALRDYAEISTMENGQLRKASDVLAELAAKWDTLTETQRAAVAEAVAGKRQANVLMALMGDWQSYEKMLDEYQNSAGTAAKENEIYMDSWEAKTKQVSAAWNELIASIVDSDAIKSVLDLITSLLGALESIISNPIVQGALKLVTGALNITLGVVGGILDGIGDVLDQFSEGIKRAFESADEAAKRHRENLEKLNDQYDELFGAESRYQELLSRKDSLTWAEWQEIEALEKERDLLEQIIDLEQQSTERAEKRAREEKWHKHAEDLSYNYGQATFQFENYHDAEAMLGYMEAIIADGQEYYDTLVSMKKAGEELTAGEENYIRAFKSIDDGLKNAKNSTEAYGYLIAAYSLLIGNSYEYAAEQANQAMDEISESVGSVPDEKTIQVRVDGAERALEALQRLTGLGAGMTVDLGIPGYASGTHSAKGGAALVNENGPEMISANGLAWIAGGGKPTVTMLPKGATVLTAQQTRNATGGKNISGIPAFANGTDGSGATGLESIWEAFADAAERNNQYRYFTGSRLTANRLTESERIAQDREWWANHPEEAEAYLAARAAGRAATNRGGGGSGAGGPTPPNFKALEDDLSKLLKNLDAQAKLAENEEDYLKAMMVYGDAQNAIAELLEQYRANGYAEDSDEVLRLANLGYDYAAKQLGGYDKLQKNLVDALNALTSATDKENELLERREAVEKAQEALANAERQRTVRIFNPVTGQWEWVANAADVQKAQESLKSAEEALRKEELSQAVDAIKNASAADLGNMVLSPAILDALFGGTPEQQSAFLNALGAATGGADWLSSSAAQTAWNQGSSIGTQYNLNGITLTESQAAGMTIKELIAMLQGAKII